jgi:RNA polymerase sigma-70 factor (ECF subfamily)
MEDNEIIELYRTRSEKAIEETAKKYGNYCFSIAFRILHDKEDSEECVNDTWMSAWNAIPDQRPAKLSAFLGRITRNHALKKVEKYTARKRGAGEVPLALEELGDCVPTDDPAEQIVEDVVLTETLNRFLTSLTLEQRRIFLRRYWYLSSMQEIASDLKISESKVKMSLLRSRKELRQMLEKEGIVL